MKPFDLMERTVRTRLYLDCNYILYLVQDLYLDKTSLSKCNVNFPRQRLLFFIL